MLNPSQQEAVNHRSGPLLILAGAGAGKTHTLTERIASLIERGDSDPSAILALTFTNKAAREMRDRIFARLGFSGEGYSLYRTRGLPIVGTFHSVCLVFLRANAEAAGLLPGFSLYDEDDKKRILKDLMKSETKHDDRELEGVRVILAGISRAKNAGQSPDDAAMLADTYQKEEIAKLYAGYEKRLGEDNAIDFDDILLKAHRILQNPDILDAYHARFSHILVDEYQDTNDIQYRIVRALAQKTRNLSVVGDDWQGIYSWRGANIRNILNFQKDYPDAHIVKLEQNYRSTKTIITAANALIKHNDENIDKTLWTENPTGDKIQLIECASDRDEGRKIAEMITDSTASPSEWAVLYRTNSQSRAIEEALVRANIAYRIYGGVKFYERKEIKDMLAYLRLVGNPRDTASLQRVINVPSRKLGGKSVATIFRYCENYGLSFLDLADMADELDELTPAARASFHRFAGIIRSAIHRLQTETVDRVLQGLIEGAGYLEYLDANYTRDESEAKKDNLGELLSLASRYAGFDPAESYTLFLEDVGLSTDQDRDGGGERVSLMTVHLAKGLEFWHVVIVGAEEGLFPHVRTLADDRAMQEERRLMYVAMTRAKRTLAITRARERFAFGNFAANPPSRFLDEIPDEYVEIQAVDTGFSGFSTGSHASSLLSKPESAIKKPARNPVKNDTSRFSLGQKISHPQLGIGTIVSLSGAIAQVSFAWAGIKKLNIEIAPVRTIEE